jgi:hypothetical protein
VIKTMITNIILNAIIRYLNFNENAPIMYIFEYKRKIILRQRCWVRYLARGIE